MASPVSCPLKLEAGYISPNPHLCPQTAPTPPVNGKQVTTGSSPQVRGRLDVAAWVNVVFGLIPAGAGQTRPPSDRRRVLAAHPRGCGADLTLFVFLTQSIGSSPRVRGRRGRRSVEVRGHGLIPAGAGQTRDKHGQAGALGAHPRGCGADGSRSRVRRVSGGSSPRVRGRHCRLLIGRWFRGLIPAGAGQTARWITEPGVVTAHPRGCGADVTSGAATPGVSGSSPRVRGRHPSFSAYFEFSGLIPAGAGQTGLRTCIPRRRRAHPRGCGADSCWRLPRVERDGLIPAGAGQTRS